jgi:polysaccharide export outer membrane protein
MFTFAAAEPLVARQKVSTEAQPVVVAEKSVLAESARPAKSSSIQTQAAAPASKPLFVSTPSKLPAASELDMSHVAAIPTPAKPNEPSRVVARDLPPAATGMFTLAPAETLVMPSQPIAPVAQQPVLAQAPIVSPRPAAPSPLEPAARKLTAPAPVLAPPATEKLFVNAPPKMPAAANLDFSNVPAYVEPAKPQFLSAAPTYVASATPTALPEAPEHLVPATISEPAVSKSPFAYDTGKLASEQPATQAKPAAIVAPKAFAPDRSQVAVTAEPNDPNVYTFRFAASTHETPAQLVNNMQPTPANVSPGPEAIEPATVAPEAMTAPCGCNNGCYGPYGCPYLPGQSGARALCGVDCGRNGAPCCSTWSDAQCIPWSLFGPGEYVGPARPAHVETYYLRVNDNITLTFIASRKKSAEHYRIGVGDELQIEWLQGAGNTETPLDRKLLVQPDGTVTLPLIGEVVAAGKTVNEFRDESVKLYSKYQRDPQITVTPLTVNVAVQDVLKAVTAKNASSGQTQDLRVTPEGTIQAAGIGSVYVQGLTLDELRSELEGRYAEAYGPGLAVSPQLTERATSYVFLGGEVRAPGRYTLEGPTTAMQAIALAGGWNNGGNLKQVVIFRRDENWCLKATKIDVRAPYYGKDPCPTNDVWLRDNDLVIVPKSCILCATDLIELYFTRGVYAVFPINYVYDFSANSGIVPVP